MADPVESIETIEDPVSPPENVESEQLSKNRYLTGPRLWLAGFG
jgi:hypothetical protein